MRYSIGYYSLPPVLFLFVKHYEKGINYVWFLNGDFIGLIPDENNLGCIILMSEYKSDKKINAQLD